MGTPTPDQQLRDALGSAADAFWEDEGAPPEHPSEHRRRWLRVGGAVGAAALVVVSALVVVALGDTGGGRGAPIATGRGPRIVRPSPAVKGGASHVPASGAGGGSSGLGTGSVAGAPAPTVTPGDSTSPSSSSSVPALPAGIVGQAAKVEMNGSANVTVRRGGLSGALATLTGMAVGSGGYVASSSVQTGTPPSPVPTPEPPSTGSAAASVSASASADLTLEIPTGAYQGVVDRLDSVGTVTSLTTRADDVSGQYTDLQARITALEASRQQYLTIMTQATTISDILAVQNDIDQLQSQIEQLQGQLNLLDSQTTYGSLAVAVSVAGVRPLPPRPVRTGVDSAWHDAVSGFMTGVNGIVRISGPLLFALLCLGALVLVVLAARRLFRRRHSEAPHD